MTTEQKLDRLTTLLADLGGIVNTLPASVVAHDNQIEALIKVAERHDTQFAETDRRLKELAEMIANTEKQWQAYLNTLPRT